MTDEELALHKKRISNKYYLNARLRTTTGTYYACFKEDKGIRATSSPTCTIPFPLLYKWEEIIDID